MKFVDTWIVSMDGITFMDENILVKQNSPHACNHTYGGIYTNEWIWNSWIKIDNMDGEISHMNEIQ
jgi:hypothetical protein